MRESGTDGSYVGYLQLLRRNRPFRLLWYGQFVSQLGDWFDSIALFALLLRLTNSGTAIGLLLVAEFLPPALVGLGAGIVVDRLPRKTVMIAADLGRAVLVLLFLLIRSPDMVWLVYVITALKFSLAAFFEPARSAAIPGVVAQEELVAANAISGITWSAMLAIGAALGGIVTGMLGTSTAFVIDALSFVLSAYFIARVPLPRRAANTGPGTGMDDLREAGHFLHAHRKIALYTFTKGLWNFGGGALLLLAFYGRDFFPLGADGAVSIGLLYAARGLGTAVGPVLAQRLGGDSARFLARAIAPAFLLTGLGYAFYSWAPSLALAALCLVVAHMGGATQWVYSSALIQMHVPDRLRGRVFSAEYVAWTLTASVSSFLVGRAHDAGYSARTLALVMAAAFALASAPLWVLWRSGRPIQVERPEVMEAASRNY